MRRGYVDVEIEWPRDGRLNCGALHFRSTDGEELSAQEILDALADALLVNWPIHDMTGVPTDGDA